MNYLALGDSYTIGEGVVYFNNFPNLVAKKMEQLQIVLNELSIIATTGWTTDELIAQMELQVKKQHYDWVTILIGVNNQYRGRTVEEYEIHFRYILNRAITFAQGNAKQVIVLSIPDWGLTPFNTEKDKVVISQQIDAYNEVAKKASLEVQSNYIDITSSTRRNANDSHFLALDGLHPSANEYQIWANEIVEIMTK